MNCQERPGRTFSYNVGKHGNDRDHRQKSHQRNEGDAHPLNEEPVEGDAAFHESTLSARFLDLKTIEEAMILTINEMTKRTRPMKNRT